MDTILFMPVYGMIQSIRPFAETAGNCCSQIAAVRTGNGIVNLIITPDTYVVNETRLRRGMQIAAFYDGNAPMPLIFPPQYRALVVTRQRPQENIVMDYFDDELTAVNQSLTLNVGPQTEIRTNNGQSFHCSLENRLLIVYYTTTTRSIPPQTTPQKIIVMC